MKRCRDAPIVFIVLSVDRSAAADCPMCRAEFPAAEDAASESREIKSIDGRLLLLLPVAGGPGPRE